MGYEYYRKGNKVGAAAMTTLYSFYDFANTLSFGTLEDGSVELEKNQSFSDAASNFTKKQVTKAEEYAEEVVAGGIVAGTAKVAKDIACSRAKAICKTVQKGIDKAQDTFDKKTTNEGRSGSNQQQAKNTETTNNDSDGINLKLKARKKALREYKQRKGLNESDKVTSKQFKNFKRRHSGAAGKKLYDKKSLYKDPKVSANSTNNNAPEHHICTNKNCKSTASGGPWTPRFEAIFKKAGLNLNDAINKVRVPGHKGPHSEGYHMYVQKQLLSATQGLKANTNAYKNAVTGTLDRIRQEATTTGSQVNKWLTKK